MARPTSILWLVTGVVSLAGCVFFGVAFYPRGESEESKYARAAERKRAIDLVDAGLVAFGEEDLAGAIANYNEGLRLYPANRPGHYFLGTALAKSGKYDEAIAEFDRVIELEAVSPQAYNGRGAARWKLGDQAEAAADFERALALEPGFPAARANLGYLYLHRGELREAVAAFDAVVAAYADPRYCASAYEARGIARAKLGDLEGAEADITLAFESASDKERNLRILSNRARVREARGDLAGAQADRAERARLESLPKESKEFVRLPKGGDAKPTKG